MAEEQEEEMVFGVQDSATEIAGLSDDEYMDLMLATLISSSEHVKRTEMIAETELTLINISQVPIKPLPAKVSLRLPETFNGFTNHLPGQATRLTNITPQENVRTIERVQRGMTEVEIRRELERETTAVTAPQEVPPPPTEAEVVDMVGAEVIAPDGGVGVALSEAQAEARFFLLGDEMVEPLFERHYYPPAVAGGRARILYKLRADSFNPTVDDHRNAAIMIEKLTNENMLMLIHEAHRIEAARNFPGTDRPPIIVSAVYNYQNESGRVGGKPDYIPESYFNGTIPQLGVTLLQVNAAMMDNFFEISTQDTHGDYGVMDKYGERIAKIYPSCFGFTIRDPTYHPQEISQTHARGLTRNQLKTIDGMKCVYGFTIENLDQMNRGYCLFDTIANLAKIDPGELLKACGNPDPSAVFIEKYADIIANYVNMNLRFFRILASKKSEEFFRTTTNYYRTEKFLVCLVQDQSLPKENEFRNYKHVFHILRDESRLVHDDIVPFTMPTYFVNVDLESVANKDCLNEGWALNVFPYRLPAPLETGVIYDTSAMVKGFMVYSFAEKMWKPVLETVVDERGNRSYRILPHVKDCVRVYRDGGLNVLSNLIPYIMEFRRSIPFPKVNIITTGFNTSRFDNFLEVRYWLEKAGFRKTELDLGIYGNSILTYRLQIQDPWTAITTWDLRRHVVGSLRSCCELWLIPSGAEKGDLDHKLVQTIYNIHPEKFDEFLEANWEDSFFKVKEEVIRYPGIKTYCSQDVIACSTLHFMYKMAIEFITNVFFIKKYGASLAMICCLTPPKRKSKWGKEKATKKETSSELFESRGRWLATNIINMPKNTKELIAVANRLNCEPVVPLPIDIRYTDVKVTISEETERIYQEALRSAHPGPELVKQVWNSMGGKVFRPDNLNANIEAYPTLSGFATMIFKMLCETNQWRQVQGFTYDITRTLRDHQCIAGRSQGDIGYFEDEPVGTTDKVSLYPTAMTNKKTAYALGFKDPSNPNARGVRCTYTTTPPVSAPTMPAGIWKVRIRSQPNGIVIPLKSSAGYHWETNIDTNRLPEGHKLRKGLCRLVTTPDVESLRLVGADFDVVDGIVFDDNTPDLYQEYIMIASSEKNRQDQLKIGDTSVVLFPGEKYNAGIREACKLMMNILSGKEITKPYLSKREIFDSEVLPAQLDLANCAKQYKYCQKARMALMMVPPDLSKWRKYMKKIKQVARLNGDMETLGGSNWIAEWKGEPTAGQYSHINGYHIYGAARYSMNLCYAKIGFDRFFMTETDSMATRLSDLRKLYDSPSDFGDPLLYLEEERRLGLFPDAPTCTKPKQFGQLEFETTPMMLKTAAKKLGYLRKAKPSDIHHERSIGKPEKMVGNEEKIVRMYYREHKPSDEEGVKAVDRWKLPRNELIVSIGSYDRKTKTTTIERADVPTGLFGPFIAIGGKKIYAIYFRDENYKPWFLKCKFKGVSIYHDWVIDYVGKGTEHCYPSVEPPLKFKLSTLTRKERIDYVLVNLGDFKNPEAHRMRKRDIFDYIDHKYLYLIQSRISQNSTLRMESKQNVVLKTLKLTDPRPTVEQIKKIEGRSNEVEEINLRRMARCIRGVDKDNDNLCECCEEAVSIVIDTKGYCAMHGEDKPPQGAILCSHRNKMNELDCGCIKAPNSDFCRLHNGVNDTPIYCAHPSCKAPADSIEVMRGFIACTKHGDCKTIQSLQCLFTNKRGGARCGQPVSRNAVKSGYQLCYAHYSNNNKQAKRQRIEAYRMTPIAKESAMKLPHAVPDRTGCLPACTYTTKRGQCLRPVNGDSKLCPMHERLTQNKEKKQQSLLTHKEDEAKSN